MKIIKLCIIIAFSILTIVLPAQADWSDSLKGAWEKSVNATTDAMSKTSEVWEASVNATSDAMEKVSEDMKLLLTKPEGIVNSGFQHVYPKKFYENKYAVVAGVAITEAAMFLAEVGLGRDLSDVKYIARMNIWSLASVYVEDNYGHGAVREYFEIDILFPEKMVGDELNELIKSFKISADDSEDKMKIKNNILSYLPTKNSTNIKQSELVALLVFLWNEDEYELFSKYLRLMNPDVNEEQSFYYYLLALNYLNLGDESLAIKNLFKSMQDAPYAIEPALMYLSILIHDDFGKNKPMILSFVNNSSSKFSETKYMTVYRKNSLFMLLASACYLEKDYECAEEYFKKSKNGFIDGLTTDIPEASLELELMIVNSTFLNGKEREADKLFDKLLSKNPDNTELKSLYVKYSEEY